MQHFFKRGHHPCDWRAVEHAMIISNPNIERTVRFKRAVIQCCRQRREQMQSGRPERSHDTDAKRPEDLCPYRAITI